MLVSVVVMMLCWIGDVLCVSSLFGCQGYILVHIGAFGLHPVHLRAVWVCVCCLFVHYVVCLGGSVPKGSGQGYLVRGSCLSWGCGSGLCLGWGCGCG